MAANGDGSPVRSGPVRFAYTVLAVVLFLGGAVLIILGANDDFAVQVSGLTLTPAVPGLAVMGLAVWALFRGGRPAKDPVHDPDAHLHLPRDVHDALDRHGADDTPADDDDRR
ncbi:MAG: hypothetical protein H6907_15085 [Hyphomicrobiales bacterium]|nr:hypothetical protein [Hyphomicrobiales bacterium]